MPKPEARNPLVPRFELNINGAQLPFEFEPFVVSVTVDDEVNLPGMFTFEMSGADSGDETLFWLDDDHFSLGNEVEVFVGYDEQLEPIMAGEITSLEPVFSFDRLPALVVRGYDRRHRLNRGTKTRTFLNQKDSEIASEIANTAGLSPNVVNSGVVHEYVLQANQSDFAFLLDRAHRINYEMVVDGNMLHFRPRSNGESEVLTLSFMDDLLEFYPRMAATLQSEKVFVRGWNAAKKEQITGEADASKVSAQMAGAALGADTAAGLFGEAAIAEIDMPPNSTGEADKRAAALMNRESLTFITGDAISLGRADLRAGTVVEIEGIGERFSGQYYVQNARHVYSARLGYRTFFKVRRTAS